jgi:hypothetical protein
MSVLARSNFFNSLTQAGVSIDPTLLKLLTGVKAAGSPPTQLAAALAAIPIAEDGDLITSDYHNTLLAALLILAGQVGTPSSNSVTLTLMPNFQPVPAAKAGYLLWTQQLGYVTLPANFSPNGGAYGWMGLPLPNGMRIRKLTVYGQRNQTGNIVCQFNLLKQGLKDLSPAQPPLINAILTANQVNPGDGTFTLTAQLGDDQNFIVNTTANKYILEAQADAIAAPAGTQLTMYTAQIQCDPV